MALVLVLLLASLSCHLRATSAASRVSVGAIRWDAWYGAPSDKNYGVVGRAVTNDLSPQHNHYRLPFFAKEHAPNNVSSVVVNGDTDAAMAAEIEYAAKFGIDYWAFCAYPIGCKNSHPPDADCAGIQCCADNVALSYALNRYLVNPLRHKVNFTLILQSGSWFPTATLGGNETSEQENARYISYFRMPNYQKVKGGRPLVYLFGGKADRAAMGALRNATKKALGGVEPYFVLMGGNPASQSKAVAAVGAQAASQYVLFRGANTPGKPATFQAGIGQPESEYWSQAKAAGLKLVPSVSAGWDPRPRQFYGCPWCRGSCKGCYVTDPTMAELEAHTHAAYTFAAENPDTVEAESIIISAWNENDEGHWIMPSLLNGTTKLQAVQRGLTNARRQAGHL